MLTLSLNRKCKAKSKARVNFNDKRWHILSKVEKKIRPPVQLWDNHIEITTKNHLTLDIIALKRIPTLT